MIHNQTIDAMLDRRSVRAYKKDQPTDEVIETIVRAGQQAPFASQLYSVLLTRKKKAPFGAPLWFVICVDAYKLERFMKLRGWDLVTNDLTLLLLGLQDASYVAENMVTAAESLGLGSCFLGEGSMNGARIRQIAKQYALPPRVLPMVELVMGYPDESFAPRPRYPMEFTLFEERYPELSDDEVRAAMKPMDDGYIEQGYYSRQKIKIPIQDGRADTFTFDDYSWTEHISRKWGQWAASPEEMLKALKERGFQFGLPPSAT
ncbi:MAG: hypothetical protein A2Y38_13565 [Spirochaetes bacterium GWB1_59_5]|nr:MAG: hypothetical protein A2Y38_13565 [Spirochaetes bacterium GWB1_59_5]